MSKSCQWVSTRYIVALLASLAVMICYGQRNVYDMGLFEIRRKQLVDRHGFMCSSKRKQNDTTEETTMRWTIKQQALLLPMYHLGYALSAAPAGYASDKWGSRWVLVGSVGLSSVCANALASTLERFMAQCGLRLLIGAAQGAVGPALVSLLRYWAVAGERAAMASSVFAGDFLGVTLALVCGNAPRNLALSLYVWSGVGLFWVLLALVYCYSEPKAHDYISERELQYLTAGIEPAERRCIPLRSMLKDRSVWAYCIGQCGHEFYVPILTTFFLTYRKGLLNARYGYITAYAYMAAYPFAIAAGALADYLIAKRKLRTSIPRKFYAALSALLPFASTTLMEYFTCRKNAPAFILMLATTTKTLYCCSIQINALDLSVHHSGFLAGLAATAGGVAAALSFYIASFIFLENTVYYWNLTYNLYNVVHTVTIVTFLVIASTDRAKWDMDPVELNGLSGSVSNRWYQQASNTNVDKRQKKRVRIHSLPTSFNGDEQRI